MKIVVDSYAWIKHIDLSVVQQQAIKGALTVRPRKVGNFPGQKDPDPIHLYDERFGELGMARGYLASKIGAPGVEVEWNVTDGAPGAWGPEVIFEGSLRDEQTRALDEVVRKLKGGPTLGGIVRAAPGWG